ncbi:HupE/UreJ family protein [Bradyrhizobium sp.]|uniref:HupE/UreJ family protein n=1 Tax=Bradyrhizobium sp. TaxID=376 RepID=UPI003C755777
MKMFIRFGSAAVLAALATPAFAHTGAEPHVHGVVAGLVHPLGGLDHMLAMIAVGIWSSLAAGRRVWIVPAVFVAAMLAGAGLAQAGVALPAAETAIAMSVVVLGTLIAAGVGLPVGAGAALIALFAVFHGYAHGVEATGAVVGYMVGFAITTAVLHVAGIVLGRTIAVVPHASRLLGAGIVASGAYLVATL